MMIFVPFLIDVALREDRHDISEKGIVEGYMWINPPYTFLAGVMENIWYHTLLTMTFSIWREL